jgi:hypothetical protein
MRAGGPDVVNARCGGVAIFTMLRAPLVSVIRQMPPVAAFKPLCASMSAVAPGPTSSLGGCRTQ